jgi:hypothetical protein
MEHDQFRLRRTGQLYCYLERFVRAGREINRNENLVKQSDHDVIPLVQPADIRYSARAMPLPGNYQQAVDGL